MTTRIPMLMIALVALGFGAMDATAQQSPPTPQAPAQTPQQQPPRGGMMDSNMMGREMMGPGMMGRQGMMGPGMMGRQGMMGPFMMRMMFALMDADGDGTVSLQEFQTAHERLFKAMDANKDGVLTLEEIQNFMRGTGTPAAQPSGTVAPQRP